MEKLEVKPQFVVGCASGASSKYRGGWVFRVEVVTDNPAVLTQQMMEAICKQIMKLDDVCQVLVEELYEDIKLFKIKEEESYEESC